jgi:hypothetical protein
VGCAHGWHARQRRELPGRWAALLTVAMLRSLARPSLVMAIGMLSLFGALIARQIIRSAAWWAVGLVLAEIVVAGIGADLKIA